MILAENDGEKSSKKVDEDLNGELGAYKNKSEQIIQVLEGKLDHIIEVLEDKKNNVENVVPPSSGDPKNEENEKVSEFRPKFVQKVALCFGKFLGVIFYFPQTILPLIFLTFMSFYNSSLSWGGFTMNLVVLLLILSITFSNRWQAKIRFSMKYPTSEEPSCQISFNSWLWRNMEIIEIITNSMLVGWVTSAPFIYMPKYIVQFSSPDEVSPPLNGTSTFQDGLEEMATTSNENNFKYFWLFFITIFCILIPGYCEYSLTHRNVELSKNFFGGYRGKGSWPGWFSWEFKNYKRILMGKYCCRALAYLTLGHQVDTYRPRGQVYENTNVSFDHIKSGFERQYSKLHSFEPNLKLTILFLTMAFLVQFVNFIFALQMQEFVVSKKSLKKIDEKTL